MSEGSSASASDSSSDDDIPIGQLNNRAKTKPSSSEDSSSDDDVPLIARKQPARTTRSSSSSSKSKSKPKRKSSKSSRTKKRKRKRFGDSEDEDSDSSSDDPSSDDDEPIVSAANKRRKKSPPRKRQRTASSSSAMSSPRTPKTRRRKVSSSSPNYIGRQDVNPAEKYTVKDGLKPLKPKKGALKWWEHEDDNNVSYSKADDSKSKEKWRTLDHNGVVFAPPYVPHKVKFLYEGREVKLSADQEEIATMYAIMLDTDWVQKERFRKNFMRDFQKILRDKNQGEGFYHAQITDLAKCDFTHIHKWSQEKREAEKEKRKDAEYKKKVKAEKEEFDSIFGFALVDGIREKVGNYKVEPPGLFRGRGEHPKMGMLKKRIMPSDIVLNIGENTPIPECPLPGHQWGGVVHDRKVTYIAKWVENINGSHKFVYLGASSRFKGQNDRNKYEKARVLKTKIKSIRKDYTSKLTNKSLDLQQLATAVWMIDILSIRVGNEKDTDEEADTVGVCSLRVEHMTLLPEPDDPDTNDKDAWRITLDFLGKDSMRYHNTVSVTKQIYKNLRKFLAGKASDVDIFERIDPDKVNKYLKSKMEGLTAKVFRTHNASTVLQDQLSKGFHETVGKITVDSPLESKIFYYQQCNKEVAILCNHQKSVSKSHGDQLLKLDQQMQDIREQIEEMQEQLDEINGVKRKKKKKKKTESKSPKRKKTKEQLENQIRKKQEMLRKKELAKALKEDNKEVSLGTSKINYMDPRVTVAWCKKMQVPIEKIFNKSLLDKFPWAMQSNTKYDF